MLPLQSEYSASVVVRDLQLRRMKFFIYFTDSLNNFTKSIFKPKMLLLLFNVVSKSAID